MPLDDLLAVARRVARQCRDADARFIVNDRADLALACGADGLHVGQDDLPAREARAVLRPRMILGVSTHDPEQARRAAADGADYVAVGSIFPTTTKAGFQLVGTDLIRRVRPEVSVPLIGIGGITADNASAVLGAGADGVAVISAVCAGASAGGGGGGGPPGRRLPVSWGGSPRGGARPPPLPRTGSGAPIPPS